MIAEHAEGCVVSVRAQPGARRNAIVGIQGNSLKAAVTAPPEDGRANKALAELLADMLDLKRSQVELIAGATQRAKKFLLRGISAAAIAQRIEALVR